MPCSSSLMEAGKERHTLMESRECPRSPPWLGTELWSEACLQHMSAGKEQPHSSPTAQPSQPGLNIPQDLWANPIPLLCWISAKLLVSSPSSRRKKHLSILVSIKHHACSYSMLCFEASMTPQLFPAPRWFFFLVLAACLYLATALCCLNFKCFSFCLQQPCKMAIPKCGVMIA